MTLSLESFEKNNQTHYTTLGGQTGLNMAIQLHDSGVLANNVKL